MKKALLSLAAVIGMGFAANADVVSFETSKGGYNNAAEVSEIKMNDEISITLEKGSNSNAPKYYSTGTAIRFYGGNVMTFTAAEGYEITDITITQPSGGNGWNTGSTVAVDGGAASTDLFKGKTGSQNTEAESIWTGNATNVVVTNGGTKNNVRLGTITVTYNSTVAAAVERPVFSQNGNTVTITCATEGAEIYYTEAYEGEADQPTAESTKYTGPMEIWFPNVYKAIAVKDGEVSAVTSYAASYIFSEAEDFGLLADMPMMLGDGLSRTTFELNFPMHVCAQLGSNLWLRDNTGNAMLAYDYNLGTYTNGQVISGFTANLTMYNDVLPELTNVTNIGTVTAGEAVEPNVVEIGGIYPSMLNWYVKLVGIELSGVNGRNATATQNGESIALYSYANSYTYPAEGVYNLIAAVSIHGETLQLTPIAFEDAEVVETPAITPAASSLDIDTQSIEITCATEGAEIYYTTNGEDPDDSNGEYYSAPISLSGTVGATVTVKARAYKYGFVPSEIATVTYQLTSGVEDVVLGSDAAAEYFNLQGVRVAQPAAGLYLRRCGDKVEKVVVK
ncbi:MAG: hypothetical protein HFJ87_01660 [Muribaculaceae bacterium]|nr:hypothetical protein [Muribaculaceae bacterium]